jgi:N-acyl-D-aspartate/D-glutamate deacylase
MLDLIIKNGLVFDGLGAPPARRDVGIKDGVIAVIAPHLSIPAAEVRDAAGLWVTPSANHGRWPTSFSASRPSRMR